MPILGIFRILNALYFAVHATAQRLKADVDRTIQRWNCSSRDLSRDLICRLAAAKIN